MITYIAIQRLYNKVEQWLAKKSSKKLKRL